MKKGLAFLALLLIVVALRRAELSFGQAEEVTGTTDDSGREWTMPVNVSKSPELVPEASWPTVDVSADGRMVYLAWCGRRNEKQDIYYALSIDGGAQWSAADAVAETEEDSLRPSLVVYGTMPHVAWADESTRLTHVTYQWSLDTGDVLQVPNERNWLAVVPRLALGPGGELHLALQGGVGVETDILYSRRDAGASSWPTATLAYTHHDSAGSQNPAIAVSADGQTDHLVWQENESATRSWVFYQRGQRSGADVLWGETISLTVGITRSVRPGIALGPQGTVHVVWGDQTAGRKEQYVRYIRSEDGGVSWGPSVRVSADPVRINDDVPTDIVPALAVSPSGAVCVAWHGFYLGMGVDAEEIYVACSDDGGETWSTPVNVSRSREIISIRPVMAVGSNGALHVAWEEWVSSDPGSGSQIMYAHSFPHLTFLPMVQR